MSREAVKRWRSFATGTTVTYRGVTRSWADHIRLGKGYADEEELVQPRVFPRFAEELLGFQIGVTLSAEAADASGRPDFTPADAVTHPFVFETKSTNLGVELKGWDQQVLRYLTESTKRIKRVVLTNVVGLKVFELDSSGAGLKEVLRVNLAALLEDDLDAAVKLKSATGFAEFLRMYRRQDLNPDQKLERARQAPDWVPAFEGTDADWLSARLDSVVVNLTADVKAQIDNGVLLDEARLSDVDRSLIEAELRRLEWRLAETKDPPTRSLSDYLAARSNSHAGKALAQYSAHVAYFCGTRILLVRIFEDLQLLDPVLYDGGLDTWLSRLDDVVPDVIDHSFRKARQSYPSLFDQSNAYTWFQPDREALIEVVYELANTYLGAIESDVLGSVYEALLERVDRKLLGQYYTPRDVISLIWDLVDSTELFQAAEAQDRSIRVLDIASGSGGFLVEGARRLRVRFEEQKTAGAAQGAGGWVRTAARGLTGVEIQRFPAYLGELNLLIQMALGASVGVKEGEARPAIPPLGIICSDTLATHNPVGLFSNGDTEPDDRGQFDDPARQSRYAALCDPAEGDDWFDLAIGNPPYVGEKMGAKMIRSTRDRMPYWDNYYALHMDYLSWFLILGVSKLRDGGRFGFITSEYWLRATGAAELRGYLARHCRIDHLVLFRDMRLFPDAPGHHSLVVTGTRCVSPGDRAPEADPADSSHKPKVSFITAGSGRDAAERRAALEAVRKGRTTARARTFNGRVAPGPLGKESWAEVIMTRDQLSRRRKMRALGDPVLSVADEGVITGADRLTAGNEQDLPQATLNQLRADSVRGIFVLTPEEVGTLGPLNADEKERVRTIINTRDVFPYACIPDSGGDRMLYLPDPAKLEVDAGGGEDFDFSKDLPHISSHLERFEPVLKAKVDGYDEKRPWWTIHRGRPRIAAAEGSDPKWADYALTARWGEEHRLVVGIAPRRTVPQSSLHALIPVKDAPAAYLVGIFNSTPVRELTDALGPGQLRMEELFDLGVPLLPSADRKVITSAGLELADLVETLVIGHAPRWPSLSRALRSDPALETFEPTGWVPADPPRAQAGTLSSVDWIAEILPPTGVRQPIREIQTEQTLFGSQIVARSDGRKLSFRLSNPDDHELSSAVAALLIGAQDRGLELRDLPGLVVPVSSKNLVAALESDRNALQAALDRYNQLRSEVDSRITARL